MAFDFITDGLKSEYLYLRFINNPNFEYDENISFEIRQDFMKNFDTTETIYWQNMVKNYETILSNTKTNL